MHTARTIVVDLLYARSMTAFFVGAQMGCGTCKFLPTTLWGMQWYSTRPGQRTWQIISDTAALTTMVAAVVTSITVRDAIADLAAFGQHVRDAGGTFTTTMHDAAEGVSQVPLVGDGLGAPLLEAGAAGEQLTDAGDALVSGATTLASAVGTALWLLPAMFLVIVWLIPRIKFATHARSTAALLRVPGGRDLLALRAFTTVPSATLLRQVPAPLEVMRAGDESQLDALAAMTLQAHGARVPRSSAT